MSVHVAIVGPAAPAEFRDHFEGRASRTVASLAGLGGAPVNALVRALLEAGARVDLVTLDSTLARPVIVRGDQLTLMVAHYRERTRLRARDAFGAERRAIEGLLAESTADLLHAHWTYEFALAALRTNRPCVVTAHDSPWQVLHLMPDPYRVLRTGMALRVARKAHHMTAVSPTVARTWRRHLGYRGSMRVVGNVVEPAESLLAPSPEPVVLCVGNASPLKNIRSLLEAFRLVRLARPSACLDLVGQDLGAEGSMSRWARSRGLAGGVSFSGQIAHVELMHRMRTASVLCHPSLEESFGMAVAEAMSAGLPVVAGLSAGALPWLLRGGEAGYLTDVRDPRAIAATIVHVLLDPVDAQLRASGGRQRAAEFAPAPIAREYLSEYARVLPRAACVFAQGRP